MSKAMSRLPRLSPQRRAAIQARAHEVLSTYVRHRPTVQRILTASFVLYCLGTTWRSLSGRGPKRESSKVPKRGKGKGREPICIHSNGRS